MKSETYPHVLDIWESARGLIDQLGGQAADVAGEGVHDLAAQGDWKAVADYFLLRQAVDRLLEGPELMALVEAGTAPPMDFVELDLPRPLSIAWFRAFWRREIETRIDAVKYRLEEWWRRAVRGEKPEAFILTRDH